MYLTSLCRQRVLVIDLVHCLRQRERCAPRTLQMTRSAMKSGVGEMRESENDISVTDKDLQASEEPISPKEATRRSGGSFSAFIGGQIERGLIEQPVPDDHRDISSSYWQTVGVAGNFVPRTPARTPHELPQRPSTFPTFDTEQLNAESLWSSVSLPEDFETLRSVVLALPPFRAIPTSNQSPLLKPFADSSETDPFIESTKLVCDSAVSRAKNKRDVIRAKASWRTSANSSRSPTSCKGQTLRQGSQSQLPVTPRSRQCSDDMATGFQRVSGDARRYPSSNFTRVENRPPMSTVLCRNGPQCRKFQEGQVQASCVNHSTGLQLTGTCNYNHDFSGIAANGLNNVFVFPVKVGDPLS